jgi:hypothetical protein
VSEVRFVTTATEKREFRTCRRKWWLTTQEKLKRRNAIAWELEFGDCVHKGLEAYYKSDRNLQISMNAFGAAWREADDRFAREYGPLYQQGIEDEWESWRLKGLDMLTYYDIFDRQHPAFDDIVEVAVEERYFVPILDPDTREPLLGNPLFSFQIDMVVTKKGGIWIWDHKTAASPHDSNALDVDDQLTSYCYGYWRLHGVYPEGAIYNRLSKDPPHPPTILKSDKPGKILSQRKDARTTADLFVASALEFDRQGYDDGAYNEYIAMLDAKGWDQFFGREAVRRSPAEIESFERRLYNEYLDMAEATNIEAARYPNPSQWNCRKCPVLSICNGMEMQEDLEFLIEHGYERKPDRFVIPEGA